MTRAQKEAACQKLATLHAYCKRTFRDGKWVCVECRAPKGKRK